MPPSSSSRLPLSAVDARGRTLVALGFSSVAAITTAVSLYYYLIRFRKDDSSNNNHNASSGDDGEVNSSSMPTKQTRVAPRRRSTLEQEFQETGGYLRVKSIGVVRSIYRLCVGTPRQGLLAPHARGCIELDKDKVDAMDGLQGFSHIWVLFLFHLNTTTCDKKQNQAEGSTSATPNKIAPPALGGKKVGVLATRSPHRFNPIGLTLVKLDRIQENVLYVSGLDLVDGTLVLDLKPYVSLYDMPPVSPPPAIPSSSRPSSDSSPPQEIVTTTATSVPDWVSQGLATQRPVTISDAALQQLQAILSSSSASSQASRDHPLEFYQDSYQENLQNVTACIREVLSMDVRSRFQTSKARKGQFQAQRADRLREAMTLTDTSTITNTTTLTASNEKEREGGNDENIGVMDDFTTTAPSSSCSSTTMNVCTQQLDNLLISYTVTPPSSLSSSTRQRETSQGSGAEDQVTVIAIDRLAKKN